MKFKPKNRDELYRIIEKIVINQEKEPSYSYGLKDVDTSLITDINNIFSCYENSTNYEINRQINWEDPRNDITSWNVSSVTDMCYIFENSKFNQNISNWDVSNVTNMSNMFAFSKFNQNINSWKVSNVTDMSFMFINSTFNQPLNDWKVNSVKIMKGMFQYTPFNQNISNWNISNVLYMNGMFYNSKFNQDISKWVLQLNKDCNLNFLNKKSPHQDKFGKIDCYENFIKIHVTKNFINDTLQNGSDIEKYKLLKILNNNQHIIKDLNIDRELL